MTVQTLDGLTIAGIYSCLPSRREDNLERCRVLYGDERKAASVVAATGIRCRRVAGPDVSSLDLCVGAARQLLEDVAVTKSEIGAVVCVTFTPERIMPCNACQAQHRLGLPKDLMAFDLNLACSGWVYGLYVAGLVARAAGRKVLLLDGDVQTRHLDADDGATVPVLADAGTATLLSPTTGGAPWQFAFLSDGAKGDALTLPFGGQIAMDGLGVFKFVTVDVLRFVGDFMAATGESPAAIDAFVPHQANVYMIRQMAKKLGFPPEKLWVSGDRFGNASSATVPTTIACCGAERPAPAGGRRLLVAGFGGGLSGAVGRIGLPGTCALKVFDDGTTREG